MCRLFGSLLEAVIHQNLSTDPLKHASLSSALYKMVYHTTAEPQAKNCQIKTIYGVENIAAAASLYSWLLSSFNAAPDSAVNVIEILLAY